MTVAAAPVGSISGADPLMTSLGLTDQEFYNHLHEIIQEARIF
jgi:hypothetical protein